MGRLENIIPVNHPQREFILLLEQALRLSWAADICNNAERELWEPNNPAFGQCAITALVVQDHIGGEIYKDDNNDHYWNHDKDQGDIDLTCEQFNSDVKLSMTRIRPRNELLEGDRAIAARTPERYGLLAERVKVHLGELLNKS